MKYKSFDTPRLKCRPFVMRDLDKFYSLISDDELIQKYFRFGNTRGEVAEFLIGLQDVSNPVIADAILLKSTSEMIGYISGYLTNSAEFCIEYFISQEHRRHHYVLEALSNYIVFRRLEGYSSFCFNVEVDNKASMLALQKFGANFSKTFVNAGRTFNVYTL